MSKRFILFAYLFATDFYSELSRPTQLNIA